MASLASAPLWHQLLEFIMIMIKFKFKPCCKNTSYAYTASISLLVAEM